MPGKHRGRKSHGPRGGSRGGSRGGGRGGFPGRSTPGLGSRSGSGTATPNPGAFFPGPGGGRRNANAYGNPFRAPASHASPNWRVPYAPIEAEEEVPKWSMSAEARNTDRHLSRLNGLQLRHKPVAFISGGTLAQENWAKVDRNRVREEEDKKKKEEESVVNKDKEEEDGEARKEEERVEANRRRRQRPSKKTTTETTTTTTQVTAVEETKDTAKENDTAPATDTDTAMESVQISMDRVTIDEQKTEPAAQETRKEKEDSDMSEDEVVFSGRRKYGVDAPESQGQDEPQPQPQPEPQATHEEVQKETIEEKTEAPQTSHTTTTPAEEPKPAEPETKPAAPSAPAPGWAYKDDDGKQDANDEANLKSTRKTKTKSKPKRRAAFLSDSEGEDDILRDYIENLDREGMYRSESDEGDDDDDEDDDDGVEEDEVEVVVEAGPSSCKPEPQKKTPSKPKDDDDAMNDDDDDDDDESEDDDLNLEAFDDLDTSDEAPATVRDILSIRERHNEVQYLVTGPNEPSSSARWVAKAKLTGLGAEAALENFLRAAAMDSEDDIDDLDDLDEDEADELDGDQDPDDFAEDMTDEQIARALARQEELGLAGGEEYMIFDGNEDIDFIPLSGGSKKKNKNKRTAKGKGKLRSRTRSTRTRSGRTSSWTSSRRRHGQGTRGGGARWNSS
ncbi:hypothetical protein KEM55_004189 [Ascosphaera atra]|nr:hypothetical protein KEM55_004189 [Ascosphaera atra]